MPARNFIRPYLRPGILSIDVYSAVSQIAIDKAGPGEEVGFTVNVQSGFYLTSWRAYYADAYGELIDLELTSTTISTYSWNFTMPDSLVVIICESAGESSPAEYPATHDSNHEFEVTGTADFNTFTNELTEKIKYYFTLIAHPVEISAVTIPSALSNLDYSKYVAVDFSPGGFWSYRYNTSIGAGSVISPGETAFMSGIYGMNWSMDSGNVVNLAVSGGYTNGQTQTVIAAYKDNSGWFILSNLIGKYDVSEYRAIRYILSPENSGEVSGPDTFEDTSGFTFTFRIKTAYEFRRLTPFAVGDGPVEDDITYSLDSYDGDTRTYTFTVNEFPDWAIGARILIETIYLPDDQDASGTNNSDGPIGGDGTFDDTSDDVPLPAIPTGISAADSGFVTLFRPTIQQVKNLGNYLWSNLDEFWENLQKIFTNPMDYIIGLNTFPVNPPVDADKGIYIGNWLTDIIMPPVRNQFYEFDCGTVDIKEYFGSFLDYASNTRARIMLPFIGDRDLNINEIMDKTLRLWYRINLLSGECLAVLTINNNVYYQWNGNCAIPIPLTGSDWSRLYGGIGRMVGAGVGFALGGLIGMGIGGAIGATSTAGSNVNYVPFTGVDNRTHYQRIGPHTPYDRASQLAPDPIREPPREEFGLSIPAKAALAAGTAHVIGNNIMGASPRVSHSGDMAGGIGLMGNRTPYIVLEYPNVNLPENYKHLYGYPSNQYAVLGNLTGYTECKAVMLESTTATDDEVDLIIRTLKSGVYL